MLLDLRETVRNSKPIKYTLITLICIPFVLVGIGSYFSGGSAPPVAEVNGQTIDQVALDRAYQQQRQQIMRMFGGQLPEAFDNAPALRQQALDDLIMQQVLESEVAKHEFAVGDETLGRAIRELPNFQVDGKFDSETYELQLRASGMSVPLFEQSFRDDTALNQFRTGITDTSFTLASEAERLAALGRQTRTIEAIRFDLDAAKEQLEVSEEEIAAYFDKNKDNYNFPERAKIQYIELNSATLAAEIEISDEQARQYYKENKRSYIVPEQREASHILLDLEDSSEEEQISALEAIKSRIEAGEAFAELAEELSDDIGSASLGGSLGVITTGAIGPAFEEAVNALDGEGAISDPVVTEAGVHLIKLDVITPESGKPFDEVAAEITATMQQDEADREYFDLRELLIEQSFDNPDSLDAAADATGLQVQASDWLDSETSSGPVLSHPSIVNAMFSENVLDDGNNSDPVDVGERHVIVLRVMEYEDTRPKALDDVREEVENALKDETATDNLNELASAAVEALSAGTSSATIAAEQPLATVFEQEVLDRQSTVFDNNATTSIFALASPGTVAITETLNLADGDLLALRLDSVDVPDVPEVSDAADEAAAPPTVAGVLTTGANPRLGGVEFEVLLQSLRSVADVEIADTL